MQNQYGCGFPTKRFSKITAEAVAGGLSTLYFGVDNIERQGDPDSDAATYYKAALQATNDRGNRIMRGEILQKTLEESLPKTITD